MIESYLLKKKVLKSAFNGNLTNISEEDFTKKRIYEVMSNYDSKRKPVSKELRGNLDNNFDYYGATGKIDMINDYIFDGNYLLIGEDGGNFYVDRDNSFIVNGKFWANNHVHVLSSGNEITNKYVMYYLNSLDFPKMGLISGVAVPKLNQKNLNSIYVPMCEIGKQETIIKKIDEVFALIDKKEQNDQEKEKLKQVLKEKIIDNAIHGTLIDNDSNLKPIEVEEIKEDTPFDIPFNWRWTTLNNIFDVKGGKRIPKGENFSDSGTQVYIRVADMENMTISLSNLKYIDERVRSMIKNYIITSNDLYITVAGTIGQVGSVPKELDGMNLTENANRLIPKGVDKEFYKYILNGKYMQGEIKNNTTKAAQPKLAIKRINDLVIPVPPLEEQKRIVEKIESLFELIEQL